MKQKTQEWRDIRRGRFTASQIHRLMGKKYGHELSDWTDTAQTYIMEVVSQTFSDQDHELSTPAQKEKQRRLLEQNYCVMVCRSLDDFIEVVNTYMDQERNAI